MAVGVMETGAAEMPASIAPDIPADMIAPEDDGLEPLPDQVDEAEDLAPPAPSDTGIEDGGDPETTEQIEIAKFVGLIEQNPRSVTSIPRALQPKVFEAHRKWIEQSAQAAVAEAYRRGIAEGQQAITVKQKIDTLDQLLEDGDVLAFREEVAKFPGGAQNYHRVKANLTPIPAGTEADYQQRAAAIVGQLEREFPEAANKLRSTWNYTATDADIERLRQDAADAKAEARVARRNDPNAKQLEQRAAAAAGRKALPKPDVSPASGASGAATARRILETANPHSPEFAKAYEAEYGIKPPLR